MEPVFADCPYGRAVKSEDISADFACFDDWEDRYRYIIELARELPALPEKWKTLDNIVHGCQSQVWIRAWLNPDNDHLCFVADSDAILVRGLIAVILALLNDRSPGEIVRVNVDAYLEELDLLKHLSPMRGNGLRSLIARIQAIALENAASADPVIKLDTPEPLPGN